MDHLNDRHPNIKFTIEIEKEGKIPFLDVLLTRLPDGHIRHTVYRKPTHTNRYLNAKSHHHPTQLHGTIRTLYDRAERICDPGQLKSERMFLQQTFLSNGYGIKQIFKAARRKKKRKRDKVRELVARVTLPYVRSVSHHLERVLKRHSIETVFRPVKKVSHVLRNAKDPLPPLSGCGIYTFSCKTCRVAYVGQTKRPVATRIQEHKRDVKNKKAEATGAAEHALKYGHEMDYDRTKISGREKGFHTRLLREAVEIIKRPKNCNRDDGMPLPRTWVPVFRRSRGGVSGIRAADDTAPTSSASDGPPSSPPPPPPRADNQHPTS